jgi:hypothetical protein
MAEKVVIALIDPPARKVTLRGQEPGLPGVITFQVRPKDTVKWVLCDAQGQPAKFKARVRFVTPRGRKRLFAKGSVFVARAGIIKSGEVARKQLARTAVVEHSYRFELAGAGGRFFRLECFWANHPGDPAPVRMPMGGGHEGGAPPTAAKAGKP